MGKNESHVNKFKGIFDNDAKEEGEAKPLGQNKGRGKGGKSDILSKIKALENAEKERLERERENEERIQYLLQKEMERQKENEIHQKEIEESSEEEAEEELKHNILQCLEDEVDNLEQEMRALDTQEQMKKPAEKKVEKDNDPVFSKNESHVNKFKGIFDNDAKEEGEAKPLGQNKGRGKGGKSDILSKIKAC